LNGLTVRREPTPHFWAWQESLNSGKAKMICPARILNSMGVQSRERHSISESPGHSKSSYCSHFSIHKYIDTRYVSIVGVASCRDLNELNPFPTMLKSKVQVPFLKKNA
jgi:hypothetical protein